MARTESTPDLPGCSSSSRCLPCPSQGCVPRKADQCGAGIRTGSCLFKAEEQRKVAVDTLPFQHACCADALPGRGNLDEDARSLDADLFVEVDQQAGFLNGGAGIKAEPGIDLCGYPAINDGEDLTAVRVASLSAAMLAEMSARSGFSAHGPFAAKAGTAATGWLLAARKGW